MVDVDGTMMINSDQQHFGLEAPRMAAPHRDITGKVEVWFSF